MVSIKRFKIFLLLKENQSLPSSVGSISKGPRCLNSNNTTILEAKDSISRNETLLDKNYSLEVAEVRQNTRIPSSTSEQPISIGSLFLNNPEVEEV